MNDNTRAQINLEANNLSKQEYGVNYNELSGKAKEAIFNIAKRHVDAKIREQIYNVGVKHHE